MIAWLRLSARSQRLWLFGASALIALSGLIFFEGCQRGWYWPYLDSRTLAHGAIQHHRHSSLG